MSTKSNLKIALVVSCTEPSFLLRCGYGGQRLNSLITWWPKLVSTANFGQLCAPHVVPQPSDASDYSDRNCLWFIITGVL